MRFGTYPRMLESAAAALSSANMLETFRPESHTEVRDFGGYHLLLFVSAASPEESPGPIEDQFLTMRQ